MKENNSKNIKKTNEKDETEKKVNTELIEKKEENTSKLINKKDKIIILIITLIYAIVSFINLGSFKNPQTFWVSDSNNSTAVFRLPENVNLSYIRYYSGAKCGTYTVSFSNDNKNYNTFSFSFKPDSVFHWYDYTITNIKYKYIKFYSNDSDLYLGEIGFYDKDKNLIAPSALNKNAQLLIDEQDSIPEQINFMNSSYFDEVYFPRTAYEHLHGIKAYEWTHPPLGKLIMAIPIAIFGMTPFAYRLLGNIAGILMIPTMYIFAKMMFKKSKYGLLAALLMALDGMHFVQTRIGTTDSYLVLFIILEYLFMYKYISDSDFPLRKRLWSLFWSGLFMGISISIKWSGAFSAIGLAIIFFANLVTEIAENKKWKKENTVTICSCIIFFIVIPFAIYILSYIPFFATKQIQSIEGFVNWQIGMFNYHNDLKATHSYSSEWYTWPITGKSLLFYTGNVNGMKSRIVLLGNPLIFWFSIPCMLITLIAGILKRKKNYWIIVIAILCSILPYTKISRIMFLYHYFPTLPFAMLAIVATMNLLCEKINSNIPIYILLLMIFITFIMFFPIYSGYPAVSTSYLNFLKWSWLDNIKFLDNFKWLEKFKRAWIW